jgi:hypothetical protein
MQIVQAFLSVQRYPIAERSDNTSVATSAT